MQFIPWWQKDENLNAVIRDAKALNERFPNDRLVSVGQSPAWLLYTAGKLREVFDRAAQCHYVPFSGRFLTFSDQNRQFQRDENLWPNNAGFERYSAFLNEQRITPAHCIDHFQKTGQATIFSDIVYSGEGMASFIYAWLRSSEYDPQLLKKAIGIHLLNDGKFAYKAEQMLIAASPVEQHDMRPFITNAQVLPKTCLIGGLTGEDDVCSNSPRLVPSFDFSRSGSGHLKAAHNEAMVETIKGMFDMFIEKYHGPRTKLKLDYTK